MSTSTPGGSPSVLSRFGLMALGLVVVSAGLFAAIGVVSGSEDDPSGGATPAPTAAGTTSAATTPTDTVTEEPVSTPSATADEQGSTGEVVNPEASATATPTDSDTGIEGPGEAIPAEDISIQVLDGIRDGSDTARSIADDLVAEGYELIAFGSSSSAYDTTTVFYTEGQEEAGRQVAADNGWTILKPASEVGLSTSVDVHIVVGASDAN